MIFKAFFMSVFVNFNGELLDADHTFLNYKNRGLRYGDSLFESFRVVGNTIFFWEEHYLRLMASMRVLRMEIPMHFTMEFLEEQVLETIAANGMEEKAVRVRLTVFRNDGGLYLPDTNEISYCIEANELESSFYTLNNEAYEVELYKDFYVNANMLSNLKTNNKILHVLGSIYANENGYQNCLLLNNNKQVIEALNGNLFLVQGKKIITPPLEDGCLNGILRKQLVAILHKIEDYECVETSISPFDLQKADELFMTNSIVGIQPITKYRKKSFAHTISKDLLSKLNASVQLG